MKVDPSNFPEGWLRPRDDRFEDEVRAVFLEHGAPLMIFFTRTNKGPVELIVPMAASADRRVFLVKSLDVGGFFTKAVSITVRNKAGKSMSMKVPLSQLAAKYEDSGIRFFAWANIACRSSTTAFGDHFWMPDHFWEPLNV